MNTKLGETIPEDLASALQAGPEMIVMWGKLRPSCQRRYVALVTEAMRVETRKRRIERVLRMTADYYQRHQGETLSGG